MRLDHAVSREQAENDEGEEVDEVLQLHSASSEPLEVTCRCEIQIQARTEGTLDAAFCLARWVNPFNPREKA